MYNLSVLLMLIGVIVGLCFIVYGIRRTETSFDMLKYKKGCVKAYKINYLIAGILMLILSFLMYIQVFFGKYIILWGVCFAFILALKEIIRMFIQSKYSNKSIN